MRNFITITQEEIDEKHAEGIRSRELELLSYDFEKESHEKAIASLGNIEWTDELKEYKGLTRDVMIARALANNLSPAELQLVSNLNAKDKHLHELEAVAIETAKSEKHYDYLVEVLPEGKNRDDAMAKVMVKEEAQKRKQLGLPAIEPVVADVIVK